MLAKPQHVRQLPLAENDLKRSLNQRLAAFENRTGVKKPRAPLVKLCLVVPEIILSYRLSFEPMTKAEADRLRGHDPRELHSVLDAAMDPSSAVARDPDIRIADTMEVVIRLQMAVRPSSSRLRP